MNFRQIRFSETQSFRGRKEGPELLPPALVVLAILCYSLRTFLDLDYLVRYEPVSLPVNRFRRFFIGSFGKAEDLARLLVVPVPMILDPVFVLDFEVLLVGLGHRLCAQPFHSLVVVHEEWHSTDPPFSPAFPGGLLTLGLYPVVLLAAQAIFRFIYQSLIFFLLLSERLDRLDRNVHSNKRLLAYYPSIVPWFDHVCVTGTKIRLRAIVHNDLHLTRNHVAGVAHLAAIGLRQGLYVLGPLPPWLQKDSRNFKVSYGSDLHLALCEISGLIRMVQALLLNSWRCHSQLPLSPASSAGCGSTTI